MATRSSQPHASDRPSAMQTLRRLYVYAVSGATLVIAAIGATNLLGLGLDALFTAIGGEEWIQGGPDWERERLSLSIPFIAIATPIWYLHWRMAQRAVHGDDAVTERRSVVRSACFTLLFLIAALIVSLSLESTVDLALRDLLGEPLPDYQRDRVVDDLATVIVVAAVWMFHLRTYIGDVHAETTEVRQLVLPQAAIYVIGAVAAILMLFGLSDLLRLAVDALTDADHTDRWWKDALANDASRAITGGLLWGAHWQLGRRLLAGSSWWGRSEWGAGIRRLYLVAMVLATGLVTLIFLAQTIDGLAGVALEVGVRPGESRLATILRPLAATLPFVALWLVHRHWLYNEPEEAGHGIAPVTVDRIFGYAMASLGLLLACAGLATLLGEVGQELAGDDHWRRDIGWPLGIAIAGGATWAWYWIATRRRLASAPEAEQASTARRAYLLVVLGGAIVALVVGLAMTIYQVMREILGVAGETGLASEIALPIGITLVTVVVMAYHGVLLRRDVAVRELIEREDAAMATEARIGLTLTGPRDGDIAAVVETLRRHLPEGYRLER